MTTMTYFRQKSKIYFKKVTIIANNALAWLVDLLKSITSDASVLSYQSIYNMYINESKKTCW